ncbi:GNAT family N-acetyltransferase [Luteipulveratus halotolerans]|uniref:N-acetyltransferase domain-containing protein n=1 Tax=Luteipulveratus halotolerans TaxID=1631356 RepID=A0A0L6CNN6_9MICO|nr:GNAT family N-acetyltransferase [Luteipulveratus halotolerans]KNX39369.1 hypothetical protein VV01_10250 [Luteipulveratus halotolerans]
MPQPVLRTARLIMQPLDESHVDLELALDTDPEVMQYVGGPAVDGAAVRRSHERRIALARQVDGLGFWMAFTHPEPSETTGEPVGLLMLPPAHGPDQPDDPRVADLGYRLARSAWGHGYAREAVTALLAHALETVGQTRVIAQTRSDNDRSRRLLEDVGLRYVRTFRSLDDPTDGPPDVEYEITADHRRHG